MTGAEPTHFGELNELLRDWAHAVSATLRDDLVGAYLVGSFALGDADIHSDCDFLVVVRNSLTSSQEGLLRALHRQTFRRPGHWSRHLEGSYAPQGELRSLSGLGKKWLFLDHGHEEMEWSTHCNSLEHRWILRERGVILAGPAPKALVDPVDPDAIRDTMRQLVQTFMDDMDTWIKLDSIAWAQRYAVVTLCRMLFSIATGEIASKPAALIWAKKRLDPKFADLIQETLDGRHLGWNPADLPSSESVDQTTAFGAYARAWARV